MDRFRRANFHSLPAEGARRLDGSRCDGHAEPIGIYFENKGLLLFRLPTLSRSGHPRGAPWRAGIDFGTSNTCVAFLALGASMKASPRLERFEIQTAAMHYAPTYEKISKWDAGQQSEGAAAIFDFPYRYGSEALLTEQFYFPTQFVTRLDGPPQEPDFRFEHGFVFPRNAVLDSYDAKELLDGHPPLPENEYRVFRLVQDVKWSNRAYRKAFLWHLYKILILHAARHGAYLADVVFSFPRAFDPDSVRRYKNEVSEIFTKHGGIPLHSASFVSESVAVQRRVGSEKLRADKIVLDVGGGTSDYTGLLVAAPPFQASYCLAARYVNKYFQAAPSLRAALRDAAYQVLGQAQPGKQQDQRSLLDDLLKELHVLGKEQLGHEENGRTANYSQAAFFGLLGMVNDAQFSGMSRLLTDSKTKRPEAERKSLCGFFLTLVVLYSALACQAARLLQQHRRRSANLKLDFIGNGSRYLLLLNGEAKSAHRLLERVVQSVWPTPGQGERPLEVRTEISASGKTFVAEGLVLEHDGTAPAEVLPDLDSVKQFSALLDGRSVGRVIPGDELGWFVDLLGQCLPGGKLEISPGTAITLIPFSQPDLRGELTPLARSAVIKARELVPDNMKEYVDWQRQQAAGRSVHASVELAEKEAAHAVEPIFITCVRCLLDEVRQEYAA
jgi:hypothetical protein